jgi:hypothetical protein
MLVRIDNRLFDYSHEAVVNLLRDPVFVQGIVDGRVAILAELTYRQHEALFETMDHDLAPA